MPKSYLENVSNQPIFAKRALVYIYLRFITYLLILIIPLFNICLIGLQKEASFTNDIGQSPLYGSMSIFSCSTGETVSMSLMFAAGGLSPFGSSFGIGLPSRS